MTQISHNITREAAITEFLKAAGWGQAAREPILGDASTRRYERLYQDGDYAILMDAPRGAEMASAPKIATEQQRRALGYNACARLAGPNLEAFVAIAQALTQRGFSAPKIIAANIETGLMLLEDFGSEIYAKIITQNSAQEAPLYEAAIDVLAAIYRSSFPLHMDFDGHSWAVQDYDELAMLTELDLCLDWYAKDLGRDISSAVRADWTALWQQAFTFLDKHAKGLALRDFHAENLFWLPQCGPIANVGLIDFQDALFAHPAYDLVSFIEDARRDVSLDLAQPLIMRFCDKAGLEYDEDFRAAYAVMGAQRNSKVIGFPVRADLMFGKPQYRSLIPRVKAHLQRDLAHPALADIRAWFGHYIPEILFP